MSARRLLAVAAVVLAGAGAGRQAWSPVAAAGGEGGPMAPLYLSETGLFAGGQVGAIAPDVQPYSPQYPLWSDGAEKRRWVYLPPGATIDVSNAADWEFPVGTRFWKEFRFGGRRVETRFLWKADSVRWVFATYRWNPEETSAERAPDEGVSGAAPLGGGREHTIPGVEDCRACHGSPRVEPLGFNRLQLSPDRDPNAIHGEPLGPDMVTTATLGAARRLTGGLAPNEAPPVRIHASSPRTRAVVGYLSTNCGSCHRDGSGITLLGASLKHSDVLDGDAVARAMATRRTAWRGSGASAGADVLADPASPAASVLLRRMRSRRPLSQMPPLGTVVSDEAAVTAVEAWIGGDLRQLP